MFVSHIVSCVHWLSGCCNLLDWKSFTNISIFVNDHQPTRERTIKYLGITFSENLTWSDHLNKISTKINQRIGLLRRVTAFLPTKARLTVYNALILPLITNHISSITNHI